MANVERDPMTGRTEMEELLVTWRYYLDMAENIVRHERNAEYVKVLTDAKYRDPADVLREVHDHLERAQEYAKDNYEAGYNLGLKAGRAAV